MLAQNKALTDWGAIALVCPCHIEEIKDINEAKDLKGKGFEMIQNNKQINFECNQCQNSFDYEVKIRLFELLNDYYNQFGKYEGFSKYITKKGQRIRLKYIKTLKLIKKSGQKDIILIEVANLTTHPKFKL